MRSHERLCNNNPNKQFTPFQNPEFFKTRKTSNQYIAGTAKPYDKVYNETKLNRMKEISQEYWTPEKRKEHGEIMKVIMEKTITEHPESYSYNNFCGRSKKSLYKNQWMHSSWELLVAKWLDENNVKWTRSVKYFLYEWNGSLKRYFPDFYLEEFDLFIEVKGYEILKDIAKWKVVPNLLILKLNEINLLKNNELSPSILRGREHPS